MCKPLFFLGEGTFQGEGRSQVLQNFEGVAQKGGGLTDQNFGGSMAR